MTYYEEILAAIRSLTPTQFDKFGHICIGNIGMVPIHPKTLAVLMKKKLIVTEKERLGRDCLGEIVVDVPVPASIAVHMAWCEVCSERAPEEAQA